MTRTIRATLIALLVSSGALAGSGIARAGDVSGSNGTNLQDGENSQKTAQTGTSTSGDAVGGQVTGVVSSGDASVDAKNKSEDVDIETGFASGGNTASTIVGQNASTSTAVSSADVTDSSGTNLQDGDNELDLTQTTSATTGDGVGGQVIGVVTSAGGSADVVADNGSEDVDIETGTADATNSTAAFVGLNSNSSGTAVNASDVTGSTGTNLQDGSNSLDGDQSATAASGDGVGGQVLGVVSAGDTSVDAKNRSTDVDIESGASSSANTAARFVGLNSSTSTEVNASDVEDSSGTNIQDGDNDASFTQSADASSGDAVAGQVAGVVTSAGGSADAVLDNTSEDVDTTSGESTFNNEDQAFVGENFATDTLTVF